MAAKLLYSFTDENPDLQTEIGCMNGIFQRFDRQHIVPGRRSVSEEIPQRHTSVMYYLCLMHNDLKSENILLISLEHIEVPDYKGYSNVSNDTFVFCLWTMWGCDWLRLYSNTKTNLREVAIEGACPPSFSWRTENPGCLGDVKDQGKTHK
ncbi:hypothetical protein RHSIM_Rhsim01G0038100 [Rhododendron simsii]|uniref:Protein kinase domain-containing protein n=1 Tax=Rhododendron simsii TaxID=118357 RepID=A0A834LYN4_RHOSS|nr:hypothetical protein RHSIM_Rhsim01G0038100 [Rhododendron simsii]